MLTSLLPYTNNSLLYMQKRYKATSIGFVRAQFLNLQQPTITREMFFKQHDKEGVWENEVKVKNYKG